MTSTNWHIFKGNPKQPHDNYEKLPAPPPWRCFSPEKDEKRGEKLIGLEPEQLDVINAALYLRRPLLIEGKSGVGKTTLAYAIAQELRLGKVLRWSITTHSKLNDALYRYDAIARLQDTNLQKTSEPLPISNYLQLGVLGTAFASPDKPRVLLIDEIDKSDIDLPNDLLHLFEEGEFEISELARLSNETCEIHGCDNKTQVYTIKKGVIHCTHFPIVLMTSNQERDFSPAFLRRCLRLVLQPPDETKLGEIVKAHFKELPVDKQEQIKELIKEFVEKRQENDIATDQLLNVVQLVLQAEVPKEELKQVLWKPLNDIAG